MATLFVGQMVRLVGARESKFPLPGETGRIVGIGGYGSTTARLYDWEVKIDGSPFTIMADSHELEPIIPEGMQPVSWSECLWQPEGVSA